MSTSENMISQDEPQIDFATLDLLPYGIIVTNEQGTVLYYNSREEKISQRPRASVLGKNFFTEVAPCTQVQEFYGRFHETMREKGLVANFRFVFPFAEQPRKVDITLTSFDNNGELLCLISVGDLTERDTLRERILRSERLSELGEVSAGVAHNFNNLLTVIRGNTELLLRKLPADAPGRERAEIILKASHDGEEMVRRIRAAARQEPEPAENMSDADLNALINDSIKFAEDYMREAEQGRGVKIALKTELAPSLPHVRASESELREVFVNLLRNAVDAMAVDGSITIRSYAGDGLSFVEVSDAGQGMSAEVLGKIFRPLFTTKGERGTGMGLATCYGIVRRHGGEIEVRSTEGAGTTFIVRLPSAAADALPQGSSSSSTGS